MPDVTRKRRMIQEEEEEEEEYLDQNPQRKSSSSKSSNGHANGKGKATKRSRRQEEEEDLDDVDDDIEDESFREEPEGEGWGAGQNAGEDDMTWKERADMEFKISKARHGQHGMVAEIGVIEVIEMFDFMCHRHLKVPFGPKINFIIGHNGSGKSAILTAIMVCLGGKANATNRAQSLKALIREGASQTEVKLQLRNRGPDAYKPEIYGESIIIERRIVKDGTSGYKIKSSKGKTISTKREELAAMCDHMNIQVDNPMNVLSQDTARQFLQSSTAEEKYKFFSRGTQLTQLSVDYETIRECIDSMHETIKSKSEILPELYELAKAAQARFKDMQQAATLELKVESLKNQMAWAQIEDLEKTVVHAEKDLSTLMAKIPAIERKRTHEEEVIKDLDESIRKLEETVGEHAETNAPHLSKKQEVERAIAGKREELKTVQEDEKTLNDELKTLREQVRTFDEKIEQETRKLQANNKPRRAEVEDRIQQLNEENDRSKRILAEKRETYSNIMQQLEETNTQREKSNSLISQAKRELDDTKNQIQQLRGQKQNALKAFGPTMPDVLKEIQQATASRSWRGEPPVGPLGNHIKLREPKWAPVIESALGGMLNSFAVQNHEDRKTLADILSKCRCNSDILITRKVLFDYREPDIKYLTMNRVLDFDNEWVRRLLIDKNQIEQTILVEQRSTADQITSSGRGGGMPDNVHQCFTIDLFRVGDRSGGASSLSMSRYRGPPRLTKNVDHELEVLEGRARKIEDSLRYSVKETQEISNKTHELEAERLQTKRTQVQLEKELKMKTRAIEDLQESLQEDEPTNLNAYEESKQQILEEIETMKKQYEPIVVQKQTIQQAMEPLRQELMEILKAIKSRESGAMKIRNELEQLSLRKQDVMPKIQHWTKKLENEKRAILEAELDLKEKTIFLQESTVKATEYCERVKVSGTRHQLEREIKLIQDRLREQEAQRGCSLEEITTDMSRKQEEYKAAKLAIHHLTQFVTQLKATLHQRLSRWREFRAQMSLRSKINFSLQLAQRGYSGELEFHHAEKKLSIRVETEDQRTAKSGVARDKDPKSLSGGEKSFSTICLLLALWDSMASSIRCLDEFDVFMDAVNRRMSMKMLIDTARESDGVQYILITPQDASSVSPGVDVRVHRLHDPERNQGTIQ